MNQPEPRAVGSSRIMAAAVKGVQAALWRVAFFSFFINLLALTSSLYMLQIYDRVLASHSGYTLIYLTLLAAGCLLTMALLEVVRSRLLVRMGARLDAQLSEKVFALTLAGGRNSQSLRDLEQVRGFVTGPTMLSLLDAPWMPVYIAFIYLLHPWLGHVALVGGVCLFLLGLWNEQVTRRPLQEAGSDLAASQQFAELSARNVDAVRAMGMTPALSKVWRDRHDFGLGLQGLASDRAAVVAAIAKSMRLFLQIAILGVGAWLVILQQSTAGIMIAASIIMGRALAPLESAISGWRALVAARVSHHRLRREFERLAEQPEQMALPRPDGRVVFENVSAGPPGAGRVTVADLEFTLEPGTCLGITGPSAAGKSTIARLAVGAWPALRGVVRLDGVDVAQWRREELGPYVGYLPQDIELFPGSVAANIARFGEIDSKQVVEAAQLAGSHELILRLPNGYDTRIGPSGTNLSGGQRQRIGLARALYGLPPLIVLDEPTAHLDAEGESAVRRAMDKLRELGRTLIVIAHRPSVLGGTDRMMVVANCRILNHGPTHELMPAITRRVVARGDVIEPRRA